MRDSDMKAMFEEMEAEVHAVNVANGWFEEERPFAADIALLHSEVSEMFEAYREWGLDDATGRIFKVVSPELHTLSKPEGIGSEAADLMIRLLDTAYRYNIDLVAEYRRKMAFNRTRSYKHGGKLL